MHSSWHCGLRMWGSLGWHSQIATRDDSGVSVEAQMWHDPSSPLSAGHAMDSTRGLCMQGKCLITGLHPSPRGMLSEALRQRYPD